MAFRMSGSRILTITDFQLCGMWTYVHIYDPCMWLHMESTGQPLDVILRKPKHLYWGRADPWPGVHELG